VKLLIVDVAGHIPDVAPPSLGEAWVLVRFHGEPLGLLRFGGRGCPAPELAQGISRQFSRPILRHLAGDTLGSTDPAIPDSLPPHCPRFAGVELPALTVAVCTRNGAERLPSCLRALDALRYPTSRIERLVIDNAPADDRVRQLIQRDHPSIRYISEPRPGLDWARNRAILEARGDIVAFTDDDVTVDEEWAAAIGRAFASEPEVEVITGLVVPEEIDSTAQRLFEEYGGFGRGFDRRYFRGRPGAAAAARFAGSGQFGTGANMAFRRTLFARIGSFDPALDVGTPANGGGDLEMFFRALKEGGTLLYEPAAMVRHRHRTSYADLKVQLTNNGVGFYSFLVRTAQAYPDERGGLLRFGAWWMWWWNLRRLVRSFIRPGEFPRDLILAEIRGSLRGLTTYRRARAQAAAIAARFGPQRPMAAVDASS
jgi:glycosyltransferase involved in cell wall biosynthesis